tara:strand:+ start:978 stop:1487 length:510 start_codon:yes stop_codon:yes gene_type:complete
MSVLNINLKARSKNPGGPSLPDGRYTVEVVKAFESVSSVKKSPQLNVEFEVHDGEWAGARMLDFIPLTEAAAFRSADFFWACGYEEAGDSDEMEIDLDEMVRLDKDDNKMNEEGAVLQITRRTVEDAKAPNGKRIKLWYDRRPVETDIAVATPVVEVAPAKRARRIVGR